MHTLTFKASDELLVRLDKFCGIQDRSRSYLIRKAVEAYVRKLGEDEAASQIAMAPEERFDMGHTMMMDGH